jgi:DNA-binding beta-propeller fold protein YncE
MKLQNEIRGILRLKRLRNLFRVLLLCSTVSSGMAQEASPVKQSSGYNDPIISFTAQYPPTTGRSTKKKTGGTFADVVFGKDEASQMTKPVAVWALTPDTLWVLDQGNGIIFRIKKKKSEIRHIKDKQYKSFSSLVGICSGPGNRLLFTDSYLNKVFVMVPGKKGMEPLNDSLSLDRPTGIAFSPATGEIWVAETNAHRIAILDGQGNLLRTIGHRGTGPGEFNFPTSVWIDPAGKVYVVDAMNFRIQIFSGDGRPEGMFGSLGDATGYFARPKGIATDSHGNIYVADALFNTVQIFDTSGRFLYNFGEQGQGEGQFWMPSGIYIDANDNIYVADMYNARIQVFQNNYGGQE